MKKSVLISGMLLMAYIAGNGTLEAQRGMMRGMDSTRMNRPGREMNFRQMGTPGQKGDSLSKNMMHKRFTPGYGNGTMQGMGPGRRPHSGMNQRGGFGMRDMGPGPQFGMNQRGRFGMRDMGPGSQFGMYPRGDRFGMNEMGRGPQGRYGMRPGGTGRYIGSIPNLTDKQKTDIASLRKQQQDEMKKLRDDFSGKMQTMREEHRKNLMGLLTDEQKKSLEPPSDNVKQATPKAK
jgi:hypothetical protein